MKEKLNITELRKKFRGPVEIQRLLCNFKRNSINWRQYELLFLRQCWLFTEIKEHSFDVKTALRFATLQAGICANQPNHWKMSMICRIFFSLFAAQSMHDIFFLGAYHAWFFFLPWASAGNFFPNLPTPPPSRSKVKWFAPKLVVFLAFCDWFARIACRFYGLPENPPIKFSSFFIRISVLSVRKLLLFLSRFLFPLSIRFLPSLHFQNRCLRCVVSCYDVSYVEFGLEIKLSYK